MTTGILEVAEQEQRLWQDALNEENLEDVRETTPSYSQIDIEMMCDIQQLVGWLIAKSEQLLYRYVEVLIMHMYMYVYTYMIYVYMHIFYITSFLAAQTSRNHGCTLEANLMEVNKSIEARVDHGKGAGAGLRQVHGDLHGDLKCGRTPLVMKLTLFLNQILPQKKSKCYKIEIERQH